MSSLQIQVILFITLIHLSLQYAHRSMADKNYDGESKPLALNPSTDQLENRKRPFCNAFTGCGRKRSEIPPQVPQQQDDLVSDDSIGSLLDLNSEPAVEDLMRQIMSEAKLWEAIQEANRELKTSKSGGQQRGHFNIAFSSQ